MDPYKEYMIHVPAKWRDFTQADSRRHFNKHNNNNNRTSGFSSFMPRTLAERNRVVEELATSERGGLAAHHRGRRRGGQQWMSEMKEVVEQERTRAEAQRNAAALEEHLRREHERRIAHRERMLIPPTVDGRPMPVAYHALREEFPEETSKYEAMLSAASNLALAEARDAVRAKTEAAQEKKEAALKAHSRKIEETIVRAAEERADIAHRFSTKNETASAKVMSNLAASEEERLSEAQQAHRRAAEHEAAAAARMNAQAMAREEAARQAAADADKKLATMHEFREQRELAFQRRLEKKFGMVEERRILMETERHNIIVAHEDERKYQSVAERRNEKRLKQLEELRRVDQRREERRIAAAAEKDEQHRALVESHKRRAERVAQGLEILWDEREPKLTKSIERFHSDARSFRPRGRTTPSFLTEEEQSLIVRSPATSSPMLRGLEASSPAPTPAPVGLTDARLAHARSLLQRKSEEDAARRREAEAQANAREALVTTTQVMEHHATLARLKTEEERRLRIQEAAARREQERQEAVVAEAAKRFAAATSHLEELRTQQREALRERAEETAKKTVNCLDEVNIVRQKKLQDALKDKANRRAAFEHSRSAQREMLRERKNADEAAKIAHMTAMIQEAREQRHNTATERLRQHDDQVATAAAAHEERIHELKELLRERSLERSRKVEAANKAQEQRRAMLAARLRKKDEHLTAHLDTVRHEAAEKQKQRSEQEATKASNYLENYEAYHERRIAESMRKINYAKQRASTSLDARRSDAMSVSLPRLRPRTESPQKDSEP